MGFVGNVYGVCMRLCKIPMMFVWSPCGICIGFLWDLYGVVLGLHGAPMGHVWGPYGICIRLVRNLYGDLASSPCDHIHNVECDFGLGFSQSSS